MLKLTDVQQNAVNKITSYYFDSKVKEVQFIAPTGSGKTFMIANIISNILKKELNNKIVFVIFTISDAELPIQFKNKLIEYQNFLDIKYNVEYKESPSKSSVKNDNDFYIKWNNQDVLIFGKSSFGKNRLYTEFQRFHDMINELKEQNYKIVYIRDEAHRGDTKMSSDSKSEQKYIEENAAFIIKMTATPDINSNAKQVYISEKELDDDVAGTYLLKNVQHLNIGFEENEIDDDIILKTAIREFKKVQKKYFEESKKMQYQIRPAMLIQVDSKNQYKEEIKDNDKRIDEITKELDKNNLSWIIYFSDRKESSLKEAQNKKDINLNSISKNNSSIDVVIFKVGPATGWDIPRACMLIQLRKVSSTKLSQQTVGRIKRNPDPELKDNKLLREYWIYSNFQQKTREIHRYQLKNKFKDIEIHSIRAVDKSLNENANYIDFIKNKLRNYFNKIKNEFIYELENSFKNNNDAIKVSEEQWQTDKGENKPVSIMYLKNLLEMKIYVIKQKQNYLNWYKKIDSEINEFYNEIKNEISNINKTQFDVILFRDHMNEINNLRKDFFSTKGKYIIEKNNSKLPQSFIIYEGENIKVDFSKIDNIYGYNYSIIKDNKIEKIQFLDSNPEMLYFEHVINTIIKNKWEKDIEIFTKNPAIFGSPIFFEYWNNEKAKYAKAYIDFILKMKSNNITFYIEIKSEDDYDELKTDSIGKTFKEYNNINNISGTMIFLILVVKYKKDSIKRMCEIQCKYYNVLKPNNKSENINYQNILDKLSKL